MKQFKWLQYALHVLVLLGVAIAGMKYINGDEFWKAIHRFNWAYAPLILLLTIGYLCIKGWRFVYMMRELSGANSWVVFRAYVAGQACTLLPGGVAARAGILGQAGVPVSDSAASVVLSSASDQASLIFCSMIAALWFESARKPMSILLIVLIVLSLVLGWEASRTWLLKLVEKFMGKLRVLGHWRKFLDSVAQVTTLRMLLGGVGNAMLAFLLMVEALHLAIKGVGADVPYLVLILAFTLPALLGRISAMPGGVGITETGMVGILDAAPGVTLDQAAAAVVIFRIGTVLFAALVGAMVYVFAWHGEAEHA